MNTNTREVVTEVDEAQKSRESSVILYGYAHDKWKTWFFSLRPMVIKDAYLLVEATCKASNKELCSDDIPCVGDVIMSIEKRVFEIQEIEWV